MMEATAPPAEASPVATLERATLKPGHDGIFVPLHSWWQSKDGERLFCIVAIGPDNERWVLEKGHLTDFMRPLAELKRLVREGFWLPVYAPK